MNIDKHIEDMRLEIRNIILEEIKCRYKLGISYLSLDESVDLVKIWNGKDYFGPESISMAFERVMWSEEIAEYIDGLAIGKMGIAIIHKGLYWDFKLTDQIWDSTFEFGPEGCPHRMLNELERESLSKKMHDSEKIGRLVFAAMKRIAIAKSLKQSRVRLADDWFFRSFKHLGHLEHKFVPTASEVLKEVLVDRGFSVRIHRPGRGLFGKKHTIDGIHDIEISWHGQTGKNYGLG